MSPQRLESLLGYLVVKGSHGSRVQECLDLARRGTEQANGTRAVVLVGLGSSKRGSLALEELPLVPPPASFPALLMPQPFFEGAYAAQVLCSLDEAGGDGGMPCLSLRRGLVSTTRDCQLPTVRHNELIYALVH